MAIRGSLRVEGPESAITTTASCRWLAARPSNCRAGSGVRTRRSTRPRRGGRTLFATSRDTRSSRSASESAARKTPWTFTTVAGATRPCSPLMKDCTSPRRQSVNSHSAEARNHVRSSHLSVAGKRRRSGAVVHDRSQRAGRRLIVRTSATRTQIPRCLPAGRVRNEPVRPQRRHPLLLLPLQTKSQSTRVHPGRPPSIAACLGGEPKSGADYEAAAKSETQRTRSQLRVQPRLSSGC